MSYQLSHQSVNQCISSSMPHPINNNNMPVTAPQEKTILWQQNTYMDSGIHSGATTNAPSLTGREDDLDNEAMNFDWDTSFTQGFTDEQVDEMNQQLNQTRSQRVRAAMFPET